MNRDRKKFRLYAVTDSRQLHGRSLPQAVEEVIKGGATMIQLREKMCIRDSCCAASRLPAEDFRKMQNGRTSCRWLLRFSPLLRCASCCGPLSESPGSAIQISYSEEPRSSRHGKRHTGRTVTHGENTGIKSGSMYFQTAENTVQFL